MVQAAKIGWSWLPEFWSPAASGTIVSRKAESGLENASTLLLVFRSGPEIYYIINYIV